MKILNNKKGFTLIELLAVIVILAIVTVVATRSILPYMSNAGKDTFVSEANLAITGASDAMSLIQLGKASGQFVSKDIKNDSGVVTETRYCFTLANLNALGTWQKDDTSYGGRVVVSVPANSNAYTYAVNMHSGDYYVKSAKGTIKSADDYDSANPPSGVVFDCDNY